MKSRRTMLIAGGAVLLLIGVLAYAFGGFGSSEQPSMPRPIADTEGKMDDLADGVSARVERGAAPAGLLTGRGIRVTASSAGDEEESEADEPRSEKKKKRKKKRARRSGNNGEEDTEDIGAKKSAGPKFTLERKLPP